VPDIEIRRARIRPLVIRIRVVQRVRERTRYVLGEFMISAGQLEWITYGSWRDSGIGTGLFFGDGMGGLRRLRVGILLHARVWRGVMVQG
jgi:hypothetical protein